MLRVTLLRVDGSPPASASFQSGVLEAACREPRGPGESPETHRAFRFPRRLQRQTDAAAQPLRRRAIVDREVPALRIEDHAGRAIALGSDAVEGRGRSLGMEIEVVEHLVQEFAGRSLAGQDRIELRKRRRLDGDAGEIRLDRALRSSQARDSVSTSLPHAAASAGSICCDRASSTSASFLHGFRCSSASSTPSARGVSRTPVGGRAAAFKWSRACESVLSISWRRRGPGNQRSIGPVRDRS